MVSRLARHVHTSTGHTTVFLDRDDLPASIRKKHFFLGNLLEAGSLARLQCSLHLTVDGTQISTLFSNLSLGSIITHPNIFTSHCRHLHDLLTLSSQKHPAF